MTDWIHHSFPGHEVNLVFARGMSGDALAAGLRALSREPLACGEGGEWAWAVHDMLNPEADDYDLVNYPTLRTDGGEIVVLVTEPCSAKAHGPDFSYYRDGRPILHFSFEDVGQRVGDNPDFLSAELLAANLIGPGAECEAAEDEGHDCFDHDDEDENRLVKAIADFFVLPSPPLSAEVVAR
ncbi:hypothetical protein ACFWBV_01020 [Streptomyces sp. NPDC060030]|uniref:hypothetical protein n=1 Tax=Streptomyces sp. NPDC060030 TaxID=3347042 RepID=UPI00368668F8